MEENGKVSLSDGEWRIMNLLWENPPQTIMELTRAAEKGQGLEQEYSHYHAEPSGGKVGRAP